MSAGEVSKAPEFPFLHSPKQPPPQQQQPPHPSGANGFMDLMQLANAVAAADGAPAASSSSSENLVAKAQRTSISAPAERTCPLLISPLDILCVFLSVCIFLFLLLCVVC